MYTLSSIEYDEIGQITSKQVGDALQTINYSYNVRGWLKSINDPNNLGDDLFAFQINYNDPQNFGNFENPDALFNGNISQTLWNSASVNNTGNPVSNRYSYSYDALNRIKTATDNTSNYNVSNITYDKMGNIESLSRNGFQDGDLVDMDVLTYGYDSGNKLLSVNDTGHKDFSFIDKTNSSNEYTYDVNGNMKTDSNKGITSITYNHLNLPTTIEVNSGVINYIYDAKGVKLEKVTSDGSYRGYAGNYIYESGVLEIITNEVGFIIAHNETFRQAYKFVDHLNNIRITYSDLNQDGTIDPEEELFQVLNYYPYGLRDKGYDSTVNPNINPVARQFLFGTKELQNELDLIWYDIVARNYDPALGRWMNLDPLAEKMRRHSPYNYGFDNPIFFTDPDGMKPFGSQGGCKKKKDCPDPKDFVTRMNNGFKTLSNGISYFFSTITGDAVKTKMAIGKSDDPAE